jgi:hypothetical protein
MNETTAIVPTIVEMRRLPEFTITEASESDVWEQHVNTWRTVDDSLQAHQFMLGAIANSLVSRYGERTVQRFASEVKCSAALVYQRAATYRQWLGREVNPAMTYTDHRNAARLAKLTDREPEEVLAEFEDKKLSTRQQELEIATVQGRALEPYEGEGYTVPTPEVSRRVHFFHEHVRAQPCLVCGKKGDTEAAHFRGLVNPKTGELGVRRHGLSDFLVLPLCSVDHRTGPEALHVIGERPFLERHFGGLDVVMGLWATILLSWLERFD